ncbi:hypothetical protein JCM11641_004369 [Rhodosporidiobolus odoratus]
MSPFPAALRVPSGSGPRTKSLLAFVKAAFEIAQDPNTCNDYHDTIHTAQEGHQDSPQAPPTAPAAPTPAVAAPPAPSNPAPTAAHSAAAEHSKMLMSALQEYYKVGGFQEGPVNGTKSRIILASPAAASLPLSVLRSAARSLHSNSSIPPNTIRLSIPTRTTEAGSARNTLVNEVKHSLVKHFSGTAILPAIPGVIFPASSPLQHLVSSVSGARFQGFTPARGTSLPTYQIDVAFSPADAFHSALHNPYTHHGIFPFIEYAPPPSLQSLVELRVNLRNLNVQDGPLSAAFQALVALIDGAELVAVARNYDNKLSTDAGIVPLFGVALSAFVTFPSLNPSSSSFRSTLSSALPSSIIIAGVAHPLRHAYEDSFCPRCRFAGHDSKDCPSFPCNKCGQPGHTTATCSSPTGRKASQRSVPGSVGWVKAKASRRPQAPPHFNTNNTPLGTTSRYAALHNEGDDSSDDGNSSAAVARDFTPSKAARQEGRYVEIREKRPPPTVSSSRTVTVVEKRPRAHSPVPSTSATGAPPPVNESIEGHNDLEADQARGRP